MFASIKAYAWAAVAALAITLSGVQTIRLHTAQLEAKDAVATLAQERAEASMKLANLEHKYRTAENKLQGKAAEIRKGVHEKVSSLAVQRNGLLDRVRLAEAAGGTQGADSPSTASNGKAADGGDQPELLGTLGQADVLEAERADLIRVNLLACYQQYDEAANALRQLTDPEGSNP